MDKVVLSKFKEKPKTKTAWWAMGLGLATILGGPILGINAAVINPLITKISNNATASIIGLILVLTILSLSVAALVTGVRAWRSGERSWVL
jgi:uncharacterized membrane protein YhaH (DUF805 family)